MTGSAGGVDELEPVDAEFGDRGGQGAVEDEFFDEHRRLQQRVGLLRVVGQVLVQVAEEAGVQVGVGEVMHQCAVVVGAAPEVDEALGGLGADLRGPDRVVPGVDKRCSGGLGCQHPEGLLEPVAVVVAGVDPEVGGLVLPCAEDTVAGPGDPADRDRHAVEDGAHEQVVVLAEPDERRRKDPRDGRLIDLVVPPRRPRQTGTLTPQRLGMLPLQGAPHVVPGSSARSFRSACRTRS